jgi:glutamate-5-semialdehyde dehydrogenase
MNPKAVESAARAAHEAGRILYSSRSAVKNRMLRRLADLLKARAGEILAANAADMHAATDKGLSPVMLDRLLLNEKRIEQMIRGVHDVLRLPDPVGDVVSRSRRNNGLRIERVRVPLGTVGIIYEARPNVTIDAAALCLKAGNSVLLRGGSEALKTNQVLVGALRVALHAAGLPETAVGFIDSTDREDVVTMMEQDRYLDVIIPRGSQDLITYVRQHSSVPVIAHGEGNCHVYVDRSAPPAMAEEIVYNAKVQRPSVCNATEKLLIHRAVAPALLPRIVNRLRNAGVQVRGDEEARAIIPDLQPAAEADWTKEYLDLIIAVKVVSGVEEAISHVNRFGSHHSDAIVTKTKTAAERFLREVDSAAVFVNSSTRFTDGFELGLGAEIGISTQKLHARGPMGLEELTSTKFVVRGSGQIRK